MIPWRLFSAASVAPAASGRLRWVPFFALVSMNSAVSPSVSLKDVAQAAGVSVSTASRALNGKAKQYRISDAAERAVQQAARQLGFRPSRVAQALRSQRTGLFGAVVPNVADPFFAGIARSITIAAEENGYSVLLADSRDNDEIEQRLVQQLWDRRVEALLVCPTGIASNHLVELDQAGLPVVVIDRGFTDCGLLTVTSDHRGAAAALTALLVRQGHAAVGVLQGVPGTLPNEERIAGIKQALTRKSCDTKSLLGSVKCHIRGERFSESSGYDAAHWLLQNHPEITALIGLSGQNTLGALRAVSERGLRVPNDLSLVTFDDHPFADFLATPMTTARQDIAALGRLAATQIVNRLKSDKRPPNEVHRVPVQIVERASIAAPRQVETSH